MVAWWSLGFVVIGLLRLWVLANDLQFCTCRDINLTGPQWSGACSIHQAGTATHGAAL